MAVEIERKFLVRDDAWRRLTDGGTRLVQAYLANTGLASVRVRIAGSAAWLSVKSMTRGLSRSEFEYAVPLADAEAMLATLCAGPRIDKVRYCVACGPHTWEIDVFDGDNAGLVVAEIELGSEDEAFDRPSWLGDEVTHLERYYNVRLVDRPYARWSDAERAGGLP